MDLLQLQYFQTIAKLENMSKASEYLYVAQPTLSVSMTRLEEDLGVALFDRRRGKIRLTETGRLFLPYVEQCLTAVSQGVSAVRGHESVSGRQVRVANSMADLISRLFSRFIAEHPDAAIQQLSCRNEEIEGKILGGEADFGFLFGPIDNPGLEYMEINRSIRVAQLPANSPLAGKEAVHIEELADYPLIINHARDDARMLRELSELYSFHPVQLLECDDDRVEFVMNTGRANCIAPLANFLKLRNRFSEGKELVWRPILEPVPACTLGMVRKTGNLLPDYARQFCETVEHFFREENIRTEALAQSLEQKTP